MNKVSKIKDLLASSLGLRSEEANIALAKRIVSKKDTGAVQELILLLKDRKQAIQSDSIKVLCEVGERDPVMIDKYADEFIKLLDHKNNRLQWGAMTALDTIALTRPDHIFKALPGILKVAEAGSVITRDHAVMILVKLAGDKKYSKTAIPLLLEQIEFCPENQLPMYAERALPVIPMGSISTFRSILENRIVAIEKESKKRRVQAVIRKLE